MSPGSVKPGSAASAALAARPIPVSTMPPHQTGIAAVEAEVVDPASLEVAADAARLDVDDLGGTELDRIGGGVERDDRFVEADRRRRGPGELGVAEDVFLGHRLLDQEEVELVEPAEVLDVGPVVGGVGVDLEAHLGADQLPDQPHRFEVPARLDLQLDPGVAVVDIALHLGEQTRRGRRRSRR